MNYELNMRIAFGASYDNLGSSNERHVFDVCGAFAPSGAPLTAIAAVSGLLEFDCRDLLARLQRRSLIERDKGNPDHYRMHQSLYAFAREKLEEQEELLRREGTHFTATPKGRMVSFYVKFAKEHKEDFPALETARDNVLQATHWAWENKAWEAVHDLWEALDTWLDATGDWNNMNILQEHAIHANRQLPNRKIELAKVLASRFGYLELMGEIDAALSDAQETLALGNEVGDPKTIVKSMVSIASIYLDDPDPNKRNEGHSYLEQAWRICQGIPDWDQVAYVAYQLGQSYWSRGDTGKAWEWFQECRKNARALKSSRLESLRYEAYAVTALGNLLREQEDYDKARRYLERSRKLKEKVHNRYSTAFTISSQALLETVQQHYPEAIELYNEALKIYQEIGAAPAVLVTLQDIGDFYYKQGRYDEAISFYEQYRDVGQKVELPKESARTVLWLGRAYEQLEQYDKAWEAYQQALQLIDAEQEPQFYGVVLEDIGDVCQAQGQLEQALEYYQRAAEVKERGSDPSDLVATLQALAGVQVERGHMAEAQQVYERCLALLRGLPAQGELNQFTRVYHRLGRIYERQRQYKEALEAYQQALQLLDAEREPQFYGTVLYDIADVYEAQGQPEQALEYYQRAAQAKERGNDLSDLVTTLRALADVQVELGQESEALQIYEKCLELLRALPGSGETGGLAMVYDRLGRAYDQQERYEEALEAYQQALQLLDAEREPQSYGAVLYDIADVYRAQGQLEQALEYYQQAAEADERRGDPADLAATLQTIAEVQLELGHEEEALQLYQKCLALLRGLPSLEEPDKNALSILMDFARCQEVLNNWAGATETYELLERILLKELDQRPNPTAIRRLAWIKYKLGMFEEAAELSNQVDAPETDIDKARARLIAAFIAYIAGDQAAAKENILHVSANGMLTPNLKWELKHDIRYVIKYHVPEANLEQFMEFVAAP